MSENSPTLTAARWSVVVLLLAWFPGGCLPYIYHEREQVLINSLDVDQTLEIAEVELLDGGFGSVLTIWAIRDQPVTEAQAEWISELYFKYINRIEAGSSSGFNVWHLTWAISNLYRLGDPNVQRALFDAYADAHQRVERMDSKVATLHFADDEIHMGDAHAGGRAYAESHLVVPGNDDYLQSALDYDY